MTIQIWGRPEGSSNVLKVHWALAEMGLDFAPVFGEAPFGSSRTAQYLALNPNGRVPTLIDDEIVLWESNTILRYLGERYPETGVFPSTLFGRSVAGQWMDWSSMTLGPAFSPTFIGLSRTAPEKRNMEAINASIQRMQELFEILGGRLEQSKYIAAETFSLVDIHPAIIVRRFKALVPDVKLPGALDAWFTEISKRRGYKDTVEIHPIV